MGNPGEEYAGEARSWIPADGSNPMEGLESNRWEGKTFVQRTY